MDKETQRVVDKLDFFRDAIVLHHEYKTQDLIHWLAVAGDLIEELAGVKEQLVGMEIMLTVAQSAAETWDRKCKEAISKLETTTRERDAALADWQRYAFDGDSLCWTCKHCEDGMCTSHFASEERECWEWRGVPQEVEQRGQH